MGRLLAWIVVAAALAAPAAVTANPLSFSPMGWGFRAQDTSLWLTFGKNRRSEQAKAAEREKADKAKAEAAAGTAGEGAAVGQDAPCECPCPGEER